MSRPFSRTLHPFDVAPHPARGSEVQRAILASWASDKHAFENQPDMHTPLELKRSLSVDDVFAAVRSLDGPNIQPTLQ